MWNPGCSVGLYEYCTFSLASQTHLYIFLSETHCTCIEVRAESRKIKPHSPTAKCAFP